MYIGSVEEAAVSAVNRDLRRVFVRITLGRLAAERREDISFW